MKILFSLLFIFNLQAQDLKHSIEQFNKTLSQTGTIDTASNCGICQTGETKVLDKLISPSNKKELEVSVISKAKADLIVKEFLKMEDIPFDYALDGCFARAHKMAYLLDQKNIVTAKAFVMGRLFASTKYGPASWRYHVAPILLVEENGEKIPYVIDPSLSDVAMKYEDWKNLISGGGKNPRNPKMTGARVAETFSNRFVYDLTYANTDPERFSEGDLAATEQELLKYKAIRDQLNHK